MLRFIDMSQTYWTYPEAFGGPVCAFLDTVTDRFLESRFGDHTFDSIDEVNAHVQADRMRRLMPDGFFEAGHIITEDAVKELGFREIPLVAPVDGDESPGTLWVHDVRGLEWTPGVGVHMYGHPSRELARIKTIDDLKRWMEAE